MRSQVSASNNRIRRNGGSPAIWYRVHADLRGRRAQTASVLLLVTVSTLLVGLGLVVFSSVQAPFDSLFTRLNGAHLWLYTDPRAQLTQAQFEAVKQTPNVVATTGQEELAQGYVLLGTGELRANLRSFPVQQPAIGQLLITQGAGLSADDPNGVIIDQAFATAHHLRVDEAITLVTTSGERQMRVRGVALDVSHDSQSDGSVCEVHLVRATLDSMYSPSQLLSVIGLRLADPAATSTTFAAISQRLQAQGYADPGRTLGWDDWMTFRAGYASASRVSAALLLAFGIVSLLAA